MPDAIADGRNSTRLYFSVEPLGGSGLLDVLAASLAAARLQRLMSFLVKTALNPHKKPREILPTSSLYPNNQQPIYSLEFSFHLLKLKA
jgi:hypothetical protein